MNTKKLTIKLESLKGQSVTLETPAGALAVFHIEFILSIKDAQKLAGKTEVTLDELMALIGKRL